MNTPAPASDDRLEREARFHDAKYAGGDLYPRHYAVGPTQYVYERMRESLGDLTGKQVLEYGCGEGWVTRDLAALGAEVHAFDISDTAVANAREVLTRAGLIGRCSLARMPAERLSYPADYFDVAVGFAIIHHLDLPPALAELHRVLKPGGVAWFAEPLATNPLIGLYRKLTPQFRTPDEQPLDLKQLPATLRAFSSFEHREFYLLALAAVALTYVPGGARVFRALSSALHRCDRLLLRLCPSLGRWAWYTLIRVVK